jgi:hypothetical protein
MLSFETMINNKWQIYFLSSNDFGNNTAIRMLSADTTYEFFDFSQSGVFAMGKSYQEDYLYYFPSTYLMKRGDSTYARITWTDTTIPYNNLRVIILALKAVNAKSVIGTPARYYNNFGELSYTVWEDSSNGHINLFGIPRYDWWGGVEDEIYSRGYELCNAYPNPFNPATTIAYTIPKREFVSLIVYDLIGREIRTLVNEEKAPGKYSAEFNAIGLSSGIYFCILRTGSFTATRKIILMK